MEVHLGERPGGILRELSTVFPRTAYVDPWLKNNSNSSLVKELLA